MVLASLQKLVLLIDSIERDEDLTMDGLAITKMSSSMKKDLMKPQSNTSTLRFIHDIDKKLHIECEKDLDSQICLNLMFSDDMDAQP